jgi:4-amino-4-deoxy-L-arabinose transferase-like glycosyltransferase
MTSGERFWWRGLLAVLAVTLILRVCFLQIHHPWDWSNQSINYLLGEAIDDQSYEWIAKSILAGEVISPAWGPVYPGFVALVYSLFGERMWVVYVVQSFLDLATVSAVYLASWEAFRRRYVSVVASLLYSIDLATAFYLQTMESESLFNLLFVLSMLFLIRALSGKRMWNVGLSGFFLGVATLTRPISLLYPLVALVAFFVCTSNGKKAEAASVFLVYLSVFILVLTPWCVRNYLNYGSFSLSSTPGYHLCLWVASSVKAYEEGKTRHEVARSLCGIPEKNETQLSFSNKRGKIAMAYLAGHPLQWGVIHLQGLYGFFTSSPVNSILMRQSFIRPELLDKIHAINDAVNPVYFTFLVVVYLLSIAGAYHGLKNRQLRAPTVLFVLTVAYFANLSSQGSEMDYSRFRIPAYPSLAILAAYGSAEIVEIIRGAFRRVGSSKHKPDDKR